MMLRICHLYPDLLNLYGDRGNVIAFMKRCQWRGIPVEVEQIQLGDRVEYENYDFLFLGGGSDREQGLLANDLSEQVTSLKSAIEDGIVVLAICGGYQLLGNYYILPDGTKVPGLKLINYYTEAGEKRLIGNVAVKISFNNKDFLVTGFENHGGKTFLGEGVKPLGRVLAGNGNNGIDGYEGARYKNVFCSYLHGPLLPKNPAFTDYMIIEALRRRGENDFLHELNDSLEEMANEVMLDRLLKK